MPTITDRIIQTLGRVAFRIVLPWRRRSLTARAKQVSIISNDCWSSFMYQFYGMTFNSPFAGIFIMPDDYLTMLTDPSVLADDPQMTTSDHSRHRAALAHLHTYPLGILPGGIEIHFLHHPDPDAALDKWRRRVKRIDWDHAIIKFSENNGCTAEHLRRFDTLPFEHKVAFTCRPRPEIKCACTVPGFAHDEQLGRYWKLADLRWNFARHAREAASCVKL